MKQAGVRDVTAAFSYYNYYIVTTTANNVLAWFHVARIVSLDLQQPILQRNPAFSVTKLPYFTIVSKFNSKW